MKVSKKAKSGKAAKKSAPAKKSAQAEKVAQAKKSKAPKGARALNPVVGIGASAGGLEAFERLLEHLPNDLGMSYVLVQHLDPTHESHLTEIFTRATRMPVTEVKDGMHVAPNHVYIIPPNTNMAFRDGALKLIPRLPSAAHHLPIDFFFHSLAESLGKRAVGIILSGTASDGAAGMKAIKAAGGITFAQDVESAKYHSMPQSSMNAGAVDFIMSPEEIARELGVIARQPYLRKAQVKEEAVPIAADQDGALQEILRLLSASFGVDFTQYKQSTLFRRMRRRMAMHGMATLGDYRAFLDDHPTEAGLLYRDMFINVSGFFREPGTFSATSSPTF